mgnify:CR=1 FL=1
MFCLTSTFPKNSPARVQEVKGLLENGTFVKVSVSKGAYEHVPEYTVTNELGNIMSGTGLQQIHM